MTDTETDDMDRYQPDKRFVESPSDAEIDVAVHREMRETRRRLDSQNRGKRLEGPKQDEGMP